ncbi:hypothetical protein P8875_22160, partial [Bacillus haynesii]|nr:hypothetical protein [Bacillus haynesii]
ILSTKPQHVQKLDVFCVPKITQKSVPIYEQNEEQKPASCGNLRTLSRVRQGSFLTDSGRPLAGLLATKKPVAILLQLPRFRRRT